MHISNVEYHFVSFNKFTRAIFSSIIIKSGILRMSISQVLFLKGKWRKRNYLSNVWKKSIHSESGRQWKKMPKYEIQVEMVKLLSFHIFDTLLVLYLLLFCRLHIVVGSVGHYLWEKKKVKLRNSLLLKFGSDIIYYLAFAPKAPVPLFQSV